jgi:hypothetical protein
VHDGQRPRREAALHARAHHGALTVADR